MAYGSITSWHTERDRVEVVTDFIFLGFTLWTANAAMKLRDGCSFKGKILET